MNAVTSIASAVTARHVLAAVAAALLAVALLGAAPAEAQRLGRLFFTPEERQALEEARREYELGGPEEPEPRDVPKVEQDDPVVSRLRINGVVLRSAGPSSTWVNGSPVVGGMTREGLRVEADRGSARGNVRITLPSGVETVRLRPGQQIDVVSGSVLEVYQRDEPEVSASAFDVPAETSADDPQAPGQPVPGSVAPPPVSVPGS